MRCRLHARAPSVLLKRFPALRGGRAFMPPNEPLLSRQSGREEQSVEVNVILTSDTSLLENTLTVLLVPPSSQQHQSQQPEVEAAQVSIGG